MGFACQREAVQVLTTCMSTRSVLCTTYYIWYMLHTELIEGTARITEARLKREVADRNSKIVDFWRTERGYEVIRLEALTGRENKVYTTSIILHHYDIIVITLRASIV